MLTTRLETALAWAGEGHFVDDVLELVDELHLDRAAALQMLASGEASELVEYLVQRLPDGLRQDYAVNLDALTRQARDISSSSDRSQAYCVLQNTILHTRLAVGM